MSLRLRLFLGTWLAGSVVLVGAGVLAYLLVRHVWTEQLDESLAHRAEGIAAMCEIDLDGFKFQPERLERGVNSTPANGEYFEIFFEDGSRALTSPTLAVREDLPFTPLPPGESRAVWATLQDGRDVRILTTAFLLTPEAEEAAGVEPIRLGVTLAQDATSFRTHLARLRFIVFGSWLALGAVLGIVLVILVRGGLAPLQALASAIGKRDARGLSAPIVLEAAPPELAPVVERLNDLLSNLTAAFARERALLANVAHDMRTPVAGLRATLEVGLAQDDSLDAAREDMRACLAMTVEMQSLVDGLLETARLDAGGALLHSGRAAVGRFARAAWAPFQAEAGSKGARVTWELADEDREVLTDTGALAVVLRNLMANAAAYVDAGGRIEVSSTFGESSWRLCMANSGCTLSKAEVAHVFEPFYRGDASRGAASAHAGLGLAISRQLVTLLGGSLVARLRDPGIFEAVLELPLEPPRSRAVA